MPWRVRKDGKRWAIVKSDTGKVVGHSDSRAKALASVRARYANTSEGLVNRTKMNKHDGRTYAMRRLGLHKRDMDHA